MNSRLLAIAAIFFTGLCVLDALPTHTGAQEPPAIPKVPAVPTIPAMPALPALPALPTLPALPAIPAMPTMPAMPEMPALPAMPEVPTMPALPAIPDVPEVAALPELPAIPDVPSFDDDWPRHHSMNINSSGRHPIESCSDLHIEFDHHDAIMKTEEHTVSKAEAPTLRVHPHKNGGVQVLGWDKDTYSVTACKAASNEEGEAEVLLSKIRLNVSGGEVSTDGPSGENDDWTVYLLIRSPRSAAIDLETLNGPLSMYNVDGKLTAHTTNGPISLSDCTGEADVQAVNGPISVSGGSGDVKVHTTNGPISVHLKGRSWNGAGISADAHNGPATLFVPSDYQSSFVVETTKYGPISCRAQICDSARKTWDEDNRRIEFGSSPAMIHLTTVNGPVSVQSPKEEM